MKITKAFFLLVVGVTSVGILAAAPRREGSQPSPLKKVASPTDVITDQWVDANKVFMFVTNTGSFARDIGEILPTSDGGGVVFPYAGLDNINNGSANKSCVYAAGLWLGAIDSASGSKRIIISEYSEECVPGPMAGGASQTDDPSFKVYKLYRDSLESNPNSDYTNWPVSQGAPVDGSGKPALVGDQMAWTVFNDGDPAQHSNAAGRTLPMGLEIQQTTFAFNREDVLGNIVFVKLKVKNKGSNTLLNTYFSVWSDPDLGGFLDDLVGCDVPLSLGYCYNSSNNDGTYGSSPPAVGFDFFQGPLVAGDPSDTGRAFGQLWPGMKNLGMASFNQYVNGTDPNDSNETYNYMQGLEADGSTLIDPSTGDPTTYSMNGDPVTNSGFLDNNPGDRRMMLSTGPITFRPGDSTEILTAFMAARASDRLTSITYLRYIDKFAQSAYELDFDLPQPRAAPQVEVVNLKNEVVLRWTDLSELNPGDLPFQGYTVYQGESVTGPWKRVATYDLNDGASILFDDVFDPIDGVLLSKPVQFGSDAGVKRYFSTTEDAIEGGKLHNASEYYFRVEAYSYDPSFTPRMLAASAVVRAVPQGPTAGTEIPNTYGDVLTVEHSTGVSDGIISPIVVDPYATNDHRYMITFVPDTSISIAEIDSSIIPFDTIYDTTISFVWNLDDVTAGQRILTKQSNQSGDEDYAIVDGLLVKVTGPPFPGVKDWDIPNGTRRWTWANGDGFAFEGFNGAIGFAGAADVFGTGSPRIPAPEIKNVLIKLAATDSLGNMATDSLGNPIDPEDWSFAYRYGRGFTAPPAKPEFTPYMINTVGSGYLFQDYAKSVPLSAWDIDANPPRRLKLGYLENNSANGLVDGRYWPAGSDTLGALYTTNTDAAGPREWLWIFDEDYSDTPDPLYQGPANTTVGLRFLYWLTVNRRGSQFVAYSAEDEFLILANKINTPGDTFYFNSAATIAESSPSSEDLNNVRAVPNPYYLYSAYEPNAFARKLRFTNLPQKCTIQIFSLSGDLIRSLDKNDANSYFDWDVQTANRLPVGSGIYIYRVSTANGAEKIGKMAIFTEVEQLNNY